MDPDADASKGNSNQKIIKEVDINQQFTKKSKTDKKKAINKFIDSSHTINSIIGFLEKTELNSIKNVIRKKSCISILFILQITEPGQEKVISASSDTTLKVWIIDKDECLGSLKGHKLAVRGVVYLKEYNDSCVASCSDDKTVKIWNLNTFVCTTTLTGHTGPVESLVYLNNVNKNYLLSSGKDKLINTWDLTNGTVICTLSNFEYPVKTIIYNVNLNKNELFIFTYKEFKLFQIEENCGISNTGQGKINFNCISTIPTLKTHGGITFSTDKLITFKDDHVVSIWYKETGILFKNLCSHTKQILYIVNLEKYEEMAFATCSEDRTAKFWKLKIDFDNLEAFINTITIDSIPTSISYLQSKKQTCHKLIIGNSDGAIQLIQI